MNDQSMILEFECRKDFRTWLNENHGFSEGVWIIFSKGSKSFTSNDALEEAICFGWIDSLMKSIDDHKYKKYFSQRKDKANWSGKNRSLFYKLKEQGLITKYGILAFQCEADNKLTISKDDVHSSNITTLKDVLKNDKNILKAFENTSPSRQKQIAGFYCEAKTDQTREKRKVKIIEAIKSKNKGMLY
jgi:uncharacterized protein YdeI (YjbR/CyaY-like superfamily)